MILAIIHILFLVGLIGFFVIMRIQKPLSWKNNQTLIYRLTTIGLILFWMSMSSLSIIILNSFYQLVK